MTETIVITGATRGLGRALAEALSSLGNRVFATGRKRADVEDLARGLRPNSGDFIPIEMDVANDKSVETAQLQIAAQTGHIDCLVNNAGVILETGVDLVDLPPDILLKTLNTNAIGALRTTQAFCGLLQDSANPRIINVSSGMGVMAGMGPSMTAYRASKAALNVISLQSHFALSPLGIRVMAVCPGWVRTELGGASATRSLAEGIEGILSAVATQPLGPSGVFLRDGKIVPW